MSWVLKDKRFIGKGCCLFPKDIVSKISVICNFAIISVPYFLLCNLKKISLKRRIFILSNKFYDVIVCFSYMFVSKTLSKYVILHR